MTEDRRPDSAMTARALGPDVPQPFGSSPKGTVLDGRYLLEGRIATGGMGEVWRGLDQTLGRPVAVKLLRPEYASDESFLVRFRGEARHAARVSHPGVASVYDYGEVVTDGDRPTAYLVMELVEGEPLSALLHREKRLSPERTLDVLGQAADALQAAHALGVVHRDVKPGNLLLRTDGAIKVTDFGIARAVDAAPLTATGIMMGTAYYVSPEQASGRPVTPASDVYSLGVVAYECLAGRRPFDDRNPIVVVMAHQQDEPPPLPVDIPEPVRSLVQSAMAKDPARRPASAGSFARTAAAIRRNLWNAEATRRGAGPMPVPPRPGVKGDTAGTRPAGTAGAAGTPVAGRPPSWTRQHSWATGSSGAARGLDPAVAHQGDRQVALRAGDPSQSEATRTIRETGSSADRTASGSGNGRSGWNAQSHWDAETLLGSRGEPLPPGSARGSAAPNAAATNRGYETLNTPAWQPPGGNPAVDAASPGGRAARRRAAQVGASRGGPAGGGRRLPLPVLIVLLVATVIVTALITRTVAGGDASDSAHALPRAVYAWGAADGIVTGDSVTGGPGTTTTTGPGFPNGLADSGGSGKASEHGWQL